jgi:class 3 adenylate cyclase/tetratricopeptide (TPR) repeat protein
MAFCTECGSPNPDGAKFCSSCGQPLAAPTERRRARRTVSIVFSDITGSTDIGERLDPESINNVMRRYSEEMRNALERKGGTVEKFIGDAVMAVFGVPVAHEDDALRAVRAAAAMRASLNRLNEELEEKWGVRLRVRTGVNTGEVVSADPSAGHGFVSGDAVNVAARLEQAAGADEIFLGEQTYALTRDAIQAEPAGGLELKGKAEPVQAYRLLGVSAPTVVEGVARRLDSPLIGREAELGRLTAAFDHAIAGSSPELALVIANAGVGKSRLTRELVATLEGRARVLQGRCLPYGEGITFFPVAEAFKAAAGIADDESAGTAEAKLAALMPAGEDRDAVIGPIASALGLSSAPINPEEIFRAVRRLIETIASEQPLLVVFDDIHWAEETFLDLIEYLADSSRGAPILMLCLSRPDIRELRPSLVAADGTTIDLSPLDDTHSKRLIETVLGHGDVSEELTARVAQTAQGNPLFAEETIRMLMDQGLLERQNGSWVVTTSLEDLQVPATIEALLAARLDRLTDDEQDVVEGASVVGQEFWIGAVEDILQRPFGGSVNAHVQTLVRKQLVVDGGTEFVGERSFRFGHILVRDVAYSRLLKEARSTLHQRFATWLVDKIGERLGEFEEIIGYHLEQAFRYRRDLGPLDEEGRVLGALAASRLGAAGGRAHGRGDLPATVKLLERAVALLESGMSGRAELAQHLGAVLYEVGELERAETVLSEAAQEAAAAGDRRVELRALVELTNVHVWTAPETGLQEVPRVVEEALPVFEEAGDEIGLACALSSLGDVLSLTGRSGEMLEALERAFPHATRAGEEQTRARIMAGLAGAYHAGPSPADEGIERMRQLLAEADVGPTTRAAVEVSAIAGLEAMRGNVDEARAICMRSHAIFEEFGQVNRLVDHGLHAARVEMLADSAETAEAHLRKSYAALSEMGEKMVLATVAVELAESLYMQGRFDEARAMAEESAELAEDDDAEVQVLSRAMRAKLLAHAGEIAEAERLAREAKERAEATDQLNLQGTALLAIAEVLNASGRADEAAAAAAEAARVFRAKGNLVCAARAAAVVGSASRDATEIGQAGT